MDNLALFSFLSHLKSPVSASSGRDNSSEQRKTPEAFSLPGLAHLSSADPALREERAAFPDALAVLRIKSTSFIRILQLNRVIFVDVVNTDT